MTQLFPKTAAAALLAGLLALGAPVAAQQSGVDTTAKPSWPAGVEKWSSDERNPADIDRDAAEEKGLTQPEVQKASPPSPTDQGTRAPESTPAFLVEPSEGEQMGLYEMLRMTRNAPAGLDGERIPRPNPLGSEPTTEMEPVGGPDYLFPEGYVE